MVSNAYGGITEHAISVLQWWQEAGVDSLVDEVPSTWFADKDAPKPAMQIVQAPVAVPLPETLARFQDWICQPENLPFAGPASQRLSAAGQAGATLMVFTDMPEQGDVARERLMSGEVGTLFDKMLSAMALDRSQIYLAPLMPGRAPTGRFEEQWHAELARVGRHLVQLVAPKYVWLLGQSTSRVMLGFDAATSAPQLHNINHEGGMVKAIGSFHPRLLIEAPKRKARVWSDMQMLLGDMRS